MQIDVQMPPLSDPHSVPDVFADGLGQIEELGGCYRFTLYATQADAEGAEAAIVAARVVVPHDALPAILYLAAKHIGLSLVRAVRRGRNTIH